MKSSCIAAILTTTLVAFAARADVLPPAQDNSSLKGKLTAAGGKASTLAVSATRKGFVLFNIESLPADVQTADIANARLRVFFPKVTKPGDVAVHTVATTGTLWNETTTAAEPGVSVAPIGFFPAATVVGKKFVEVDVTTIVRAWRADPASNFGFAFVASGITNVLIGAKEGAGSGYPCELEVQIDRALGVSAGSIGSAELATGLTLGGTTTGTFSGNLTGNVSGTAANVTGTVAIANGGTGSSTKNFVDLTTTQTGIAGDKTFTGALQVSNAFVVEPRPNSAGADNTFAGVGAGAANVNGFRNTYFGSGAGGANIAGFSNTAVGLGAGAADNEGSNSFFGILAGENCTGSANLGIGGGGLAGGALTTGSQNIAIGNVGVAAESNTIRIGTDGSHTRTFVAGISGVTVSGGAAVSILPNGQLGTGGVTSISKGAPVASATTITPTGKVFHVTGTATIAAISTSGIEDGTMITMIFDSALTVTDIFPTLNLSGNFVTTTSDTLTLVLDGANWREVSRSVN